MHKPAGIINREKEWQTLVRIWNSPRPELVIMTGRRRVGKSHLLTRFAREAKGIYYQATRRTESEQLRVLSRLVGEHFNDPALKQGVAFPDWEALFSYIADRAGKKPFLFVLDEFPYLVDAAPALPSILQSLWDHVLPGSKVRLLLSGSHITAMRQLEAGNQPLYGRRTARIELAPFSYRQVADFAPGYTAQDRLRAYGIFGGLPGTLALLDPSVGLVANVKNLILDPASRLFDEAEHMLDAFLGEAEIHYSIIEAVANGAHRWSKITSGVGKDAGSLSRPLNWLIAMHLIERAIPVTEKSPAKSRKALYKITDPYVAFWHRFIAPLKRTGALDLFDPQDLWRRSIQPGLNDYMGSIFEDVCRAYIRQAPSMPFVPVRIGGWWDAEGKNEIDLVALGESGELLVGECKWGTVGMRDLHVLQERAGLLTRSLKRISRVHFALCSGREVEDQGLQSRIASGDVLHFAPEDLFDAQKVD